MAQALVPLKDLVEAKTRLSGLLRPAERRALAQAMVEDVLAVLSEHPAIHKVTLVSDDPGADMLASKYGIDYLDEQSLGCRGLNSVISRSCDQLLSVQEQPMLVLHGDLPLLEAEDISAVLDCYDQFGGLIVACDLLGTGTNLLAFDVKSRPQFAFGVDSCAKHLCAAQDIGVPARVVHREGIALDVDQPEDIALLLAELSIARPGQTTKLLLETELGRRIQTLLASLDIDGQNMAENRKKI